MWRKVAQKAPYLSAQEPPTGDGPPQHKAPQPTAVQRVSDPQAQTFGDVQISGTLGPIEYQEGVNEALDRLLEYALHRTGSATNPSKLQQLQKCMELLE